MRMMNMMNDKLEYALIAINSIIGLSLTIEDAKNILGIVILILQGVLIIFNVSKKIYRRIKNKEYDQIDDDLKEAIDDITKIKNGKEEK